MSIQISKSPTLGSSNGDLNVEEVRDTSTPKSINFGPGMEMFMNDKKNRPNSTGSNKNSKTPDIDLEDLEKLESDLRVNTPNESKKPNPIRLNVEDTKTTPFSSGNNANDKNDTKSFKLPSQQSNAENTKNTPINLNGQGNDSSGSNTNHLNETDNSSGKGGGGFMSLLGLGKDNSNTVQKETNESDKNTGGSSLGRSTAQVKEQTWDGYKNFDNIPYNPDGYEEQSAFSNKSITKPQRSQEELIREKFKYLRKLEQLEQKGARLSKHYTMDSNLDEMMGEYEMIVSEREKQNSVKFQGKLLMTTVTALEYLNEKVNPFDLQLDGWAESVNENIEEYDDVFQELHQKYSGKANIAPELKLLFMLGGNAIMLHMTNTMFKSAMPGMDDVMRQNPELMKQFSQAAASSMGKNNPGFGDFVGNMMGGMNQGQPPQSQGQGQGQPQQSYQTPAQPRNQNQGARPHDPSLPKYDAPPTTEQSAGVRAMESQKQRRTAPREDMKGPGDLSDILSRLKPKGGLNANNQSNQSSVQTQTQRPKQQETLTKTPRHSYSKTPVNRSSQIKHQSSNAEQSNGQNEERSTISIQELKDIQADVDSGRGRRRKSEKNTVSLDI